MPEQNVWNGSNWYDPRTGNMLVGGQGDGQGGWTGGVWTDPQGRQYRNGEWTLHPQAETYPTNTSNSAYRPQAGYGYNLLEQAAAQEDYMQQLRGRQARDLAMLDDASKRYMQQVDNQLKSQLAQKQIDHDQYMQQRDLAQRESEFARNLAQRQMEFQHQKEIEQADLEIRRAGEMRQERGLQAQLAANPQDWVAYEFYKRSMGKPATQAGAGTGAGTGTGTSAAAAGALDPNAPKMLDGTPYESAPPAYADSAAQTLAAGLFNPTGAGYNPNLKGTGVFGTTIEAPNTFTRREANNLSQSELGMLGGLLRAGIDMGGGRRVALDPNDYFQQAQNSWIPTLSEGVGGRTAYS